MITAFTSTSRRVCRSYLQTGVKTRRAILRAVEEDLAESTAWSAGSSTAEKREVVIEVIDMTTSSTKRSAKGVGSLTSLEESHAAEARLDEMTGMLDTAGLKEVTGTDMSLHGVVTTTVITEGAEAQKGAEVAIGTREEDSAVAAHKPPKVTATAFSATFDW